MEKRNSSDEFWCGSWYLTWTLGMRWSGNLNKYMTSPPFRIAHLNISVWSGAYKAAICLVEYVMCYCLYWLMDVWVFRSMSFPAIPSWCCDGARNHLCVEQGFCFAIELLSLTKFYVLFLSYNCLCEQLSPLTVSLSSKKYTPLNIRPWFLGCNIIYIYLGVIGTYFATPKHIRLHILIHQNAMCYIFRYWKL